MAHAGELTVAGSSQLGGGYNDNLLMSSNTVDSTWNDLVDLGLHVKYKTETLSAAFDPRVTMSRYKNIKGLDHTDKVFNLQLGNLHEQFEHSLNLTGTEDTTLTSEPGLTGYSGRIIKHRSGTVSYVIKRDFNEYIRSSLQLYGTDNRYLKEKLNYAKDLTNYRYGYAAINANYQYDYRTQLFIQGLAGKYLVPNQENLTAGLDYNKKNLSMLLGVTRKMGEKWSFTASFGPSQIRTRQSIDHGESYNAVLSYRAELSNFSLAFNKDIVPNGYGELSRRNQTRFDWSTPITEHIFTVLSLVDLSNKNIKVVTSVPGSLDYREVDASLKWSVTQTWGLSLSAGHAWQEYKSGLAKKNFAALSVTWNGLDHLLN
jgi:hypothetical protein